VEQSVVLQGKPIEQSVISQARASLREVHLAPMLEDYIVQLVVATRDPAPFAEPLAKYVEWGASTRGTLALDRCSRARAWLEGRDYVTPEDVHAIAPDVLRHRVLLSYAARADGVSSDDYVAELLRAVPLP
jgi:MoxR-like ATPase